MQLSLLPSVVFRSASAPTQEVHACDMASGDESRIGEEGTLLSVERWALCTACVWPTRAGDSGVFRLTTTMTSSKSFLDKVERTRQQQALKPQVSAFSQVPTRIDSDIVCTPLFTKNGQSIGRLARSSVDNSYSWTFSRTLWTIPIITRRGRIASPGVPTKGWQCYERLWRAGHRTLLQVTRGAMTSLLHPLRPCRRSETQHRALVQRWGLCRHRMPCETCLEARAR
jgi:hypothetical protein